MFFPVRHRTSLDVDANIRDSKVSTNDINIPYIYDHDEMRNKNGGLYH